MWRKKERLDVSGLAIKQNAIDKIQQSLPSKTVSSVEPIFRSSSQQGSEEEASTSGRDWQCGFPFNLKIGSVKGGGPDLQLQMIDFSTGSRIHPSSDSQGLSDFCQKAAALLFLRVVFPDQFEQVQKPLIGLGLTAEGTKLFIDACRRDGQIRGLFRGRRAKQKSDILPASTDRSFGVGAFINHVTNKASDFAKPAAFLAIVSLLWKYSHTSSYKMGQAILVAINLSAGYNQTKRQAASGQIESGPQLEAAWRARHKWAAQKASKVMVDVYDSPPLKPYVSAAQQLSIGFVMLLNGYPGTSDSYQNTLGIEIGRSAFLEQPLSLMASYPGGQRHKSDEVEILEKANQASIQNTIIDQPQSNLAGDLDAGQIGLNFEPLESFKPLREEDLPTGDLPTLSCYEDLTRYNVELASRQRRSRDIAQNGAISINADARNPENSQAKEVSTSESDEIVLFSTEELKAMDPGMRKNIDYSQEDPSGPKLALYGRADHSPQQSLTILDKQRMIVRAMFLVMFFLPFLLLGPLLLGLSNRFQKAPKVSQNTKDDGKAEQIGEIVESASQVPVDSDSKIRSMAWHLLLWGIRSSGAAFIKWGQWSATREDMFPAEFCSILSELHDSAPVHSWEESKREIEQSFGKSVEDLFESIDHEPLASGSIAQVHRAIMVIGGKRRSVVVKVRHPGVEVRIRQDFEILKPLASAASKVKSLRGLSLKESLAQFSSSMTAQTDLRVEAAHLIRFFRNFAPVRASVTPPFPLPEYITEAVLIETFEPGQGVAKYIKNPAPFNTQIVALGVDTYLKMLLEDNFVHTDLHPGNILVRRQDGGLLSTKVGAEDVRGKLQLILLDFGLAEELNPSVRKHFISFLHMIAAGNGRHAAKHILCWSKNQSCTDPEGFTQAMIEMFETEAQICTPEGIELDRVMKAVLQIARQYEVTIDSSYAALVIGVVVLVGFATSLDPGLNLMDAAAPAFLQNNLLGKVSGRLYS